MELPNDIVARLQRRWLARHKQNLEIRQHSRVLNEAEVTDQKVMPDVQELLDGLKTRAGFE